MVCTNADMVTAYTNDIDTGSTTPAPPAPVAPTTNTTHNVVGSLPRHKTQ
jgi:hypothetical protein